MEDTYFTIAQLHRDDLTAFFTPEHIALLDDHDMATIARKLGRAYTESVFWIDLEIIAEHVLSEKRLPKQDEDDE